MQHTLISLRLPVDLHDRLKDAAERNDRPVSWMIREFCRRSMDGLDAKRADAAQSAPMTATEVRQREKAAPPVEILRKGTPAEMEADIVGMLNAIPGGWQDKKGK